MTLFDILNLLLGLSLFLFGMNLMGETLKKSAGKKLKVFLEKLTSTPIKGLLLGTLVTAIIQSSSASTVMVVGFVNSGTMLLSQAVSVIMGANVGTSVTSWITALSGIEGGGAFGSVMQWFKPSSFTPVVALVGLLLYMAGKNESKKNTGVILLGFSVLMIGMETMSGAVEGLGNNETFRSLLLLFENPILGVIAGMFLTAIIQSSSASIGILQSFTATGAITFGNAVPIIMGQNIGTCVTALISSAGTNKNARRASLIHLFFNVFGTVISISVLYILRYLVAPEFLDGPINMWGIAAVHTLFNIITVVFLFPFSSKLEKLTLFIIRDRDKDKKEAFNLLDERLLVTPSVALEKSRELAIIMAEVSMRSIDRACDNLNDFSEKGAIEDRRDEALVDEYEDKLGTYLLKVSEEDILEEERREISKLLRMIGDFERISDHAVNIVESAEELRDKKYPSLKMQEPSLMCLSML